MSLVRADEAVVVPDRDGIVIHPERGTGVKLNRGSHP
jgi:hypothetical protein